MASVIHKNRWLSSQVLGLLRKAESDSVTQHSVSHGETCQGCRQTPQGRDMATLGMWLGKGLWPTLMNWIVGA